MAVYTKLDSNDISNFLENYEIGDLKSFKEIVDGIDNSNFIIETSKGKFILTIFESRINKDELPFFINLKAHLSRQDICCPTPIKNKAGLLINDIKGKAALIVTFLSGAMLKPLENGLYKDITNKHCFEIGKITALLHVGAQDFKGSRKNDVGIAGWNDLFTNMVDKIENYQSDLSLEIKDYLKFLQDNWKYDLPSGVVHADLFPDNVFFDDKAQVSGVIDFYFAANDMFIYDLAVIINAWSFDENNSFNEDKYHSIIKGYEEIREISRQEKNFLNIALVGAAMRFLLTRLHDKFNTPEDSLVKVKDPKEYIEKIRFFFSRIN